MTDMQIMVAIAKTQQDFFQLIRLREEVFVLEQKVPLEIELDNDDERALHVIALADRLVVGTARLVTNSGAGRIGRMAVRQPWRRRQIGRALMDELLRQAVKGRLTTLELHAQEHAVEFYKKMGFQEKGTPFTEGGISHCNMVKRLVLNEER